MKKQTKTLKIQDFIKTWVQKRNKGILFFVSEAQFANCPNKRFLTIFDLEI